MAIVAIEQKERCPQFSQRKQPDKKVAHLKYQNIDYLPLGTVMRKPGHYIAII